MVTASNVLCQVLWVVNGRGQQCYVHINYLPLEVQIHLYDNLCGDDACKMLPDVGIREMFLESHSKCKPMYSQFHVLLHHPTYVLVSDFFSTSICVK